MLVSSLYYWIGLGVVVALIIGIFYFLEKKKGKKNFSAIGIVLVIAIAVTNKWIFPNVYTVTACGQAKHEIMLFPEESLSYGKHCYLINKSTASLQVETIFYGSSNKINSPGKLIDELVAPASITEFKTVALDYIFEEIPASVKTKSSGAVKYQVSCTN